VYYHPLQYRFYKFLRKLERQFKFFLK